MSFGRRLTVIAVILCTAFGLTRLTTNSNQSLLSPLVIEVQTDDDLARLISVIRPRPGEDQFDKIPWQTSLWQARVLAARHGKPILLWEMDGHPLGCG
jgi:hypothetical protein